MLPVLSFTILSNSFTLAKINNPPSIAATAIIPKKILLSGILSQKLAITPATFPPIEVERNHPPIIKAVNLCGASLDTKDNPMGLKQISLTVKMP